MNRLEQMVSREPVHPPDLYLPEEHVEQAAQP